VVPVRPVGGEQAREGRMCPKPDMHAVGDCVNAIPRKHLARRLGMAAGDTIDIAGQVERQLRHIELFRTGQLLELVDLHEIRNQALKRTLRKPVMAGLDGGVGGEHATFPNLGEIIKRLAWAHIRGRNAIPIEQIEGKERGMSLIGLTYSKVRKRHGSSWWARADFLRFPGAIILERCGRRPGFASLEEPDARAAIEDSQRRRTDVVRPSATPR
jgi:hypothetical protein